MNNMYRRISSVCVNNRTHPRHSQKSFGNFLKTANVFTIAVIKPENKGRKPQKEMRSESKSLVGTLIFIIQSESKSAGVTLLFNIL